ncbi:hypothetical protein DFH27DRAFT_488153 [Peziza echinospora]|nr:hypothetical protein DFH27DRAFT_488153 [Peziza echinospora]
MSFGFGVGDFLAVGKLAWDLYRKCYVVAKDAPKEFQELVGEIATLSQSIKILEDEVNNPESTLVRAGEDRARMMAEMMRRVEVTLRELEKFAMKYEQLANPKKAWRKEFWAKFKWSLDASNLEGLKNKLVYHNGVINLLLTSAGNSSLQRIESAHNRFEEKLSQIDHHLQKIGTQKDTTSPDTPILSVLQNPVLSATFMKNAEIGNRRWSAIGIDEWIQAGRWWLLKSQTKSLTTQGSSTQAYADLIKASWILRDVIVKHPQLNLLDPTMQCEAAVLAEVT